LNKRTELSFECDAPESALSLKDGQDFCSKCRTPVIDMREMPDDEIRKVVAAHGGNLCVRIHSDQLDRVKPKKSTFRKNIAVAGTAALLALATESSAQTTDSTRTEQIQNVPGSAVPVSLPAAVDSATTSAGLEGMTLDEPVVEQRPLKKKVFLRIGRREFYVMNRAPFFGTRRKRGWVGKF